MAKNEYTNEIFKQRIKELIEPKLSECKSFNALSKVIDIPATSLNEYYNGVRVATAENLVKFSKYFGVSTDYLLGLETDSDVEGVCNYLGVSYKTALGIKESIDVINTQISEEENSGITRSVIDTVFSSDKRFLSTLVMLVAEMRARKDIDLYCSAPALKKERKVYLTNGIYDDEYNNFKNCKIILEYLEHFANSCESNFSKDDMKKIMAAETTKDLLLQMGTYKTSEINGKIWRTFANRFINENKDDEQIKSMFKR